MEKLQNIAISAAIVAIVALTLSSTTLNHINRLDGRIDAVSVCPASTPTTAPSIANPRPPNPLYETDGDSDKFARHSSKAAALVSSHPFCSQSLIHYESCANQIASLDTLLNTVDASLEHVLNSSLMQGASETLLLDANHVVTHAGNLYSHWVGKTFPVTQASEAACLHGCWLVPSRLGCHSETCDTTELTFFFGFSETAKAKPAVSVS